LFARTKERVKVGFIKRTEIYPSVTIRIEPSFNSRRKYNYGTSIFLCPG
jgi:hypothetical protein